MKQYIIKGGHPLVGEVEIGGAKNAALAILAAAIMTDDDVIIVKTDPKDTLITVFSPLMYVYKYSNKLYFVCFFVLCFFVCVFQEIGRAHV